MAQNYLEGHKNLKCNEIIYFSITNRLGTKLKECGNVIDSFNFIRLIKN